jgi:acyl-CoA synthetase (AMP-forming)/AMP-acid ligase II
MNNIRELIETRAKEHTDKVYLVFQDQELTYGQIEARVNQVANGLRDIGVGKGDRVALIIKNCPEFIYVWWAILKLGAVMVPVNLRLTASEAAYVLNHCEAGTVVLGEESLPLLPDLKDDCSGVATWLGVGQAPEAGISAIEDYYELPATLAPVEIDLDDDAVILYTSGTTGFPKGVVHSHGSYLRTAASFSHTCGLVADDRLLTANPLFHVNAQFYSCMGTLWKGATFILAEKFSASRMWDWTRQYRANKVVMLLALTTILYNRPPQPDDADNPVELVVAGGAPKGHYRDFETRFGVHLQTLYSLSESPLALMGVLEEDVVDGAVGVPMKPDWPGLTNEVRIYDQQDRELPAGDTGQIMLRNQAMMKHYYKNQEATEEALKGGWLHTGDRGRKDERGWVYFLGRDKDVIRKKGENISAVEVENVLAQAPGVIEAAVLGVMPADAAGEEEIMAFVVRESTDDKKWRNLTAHCQANMADFKVPRFWLDMDDLPKNATNRVVKKLLSDRDDPEATPGAYDRQKDEVLV